jgi:hypothetical protein
MRQRARALRWLERNLNQPGINAVDTCHPDWWRAEILYALNYVLDRAGRRGNPDATESGLPLWNCFSERRRSWEDWA